MELRVNIKNDGTVIIHRDGRFFCEVNTRIVEVPNIFRIHEGLLKHMSWAVPDKEKDGDDTIYTFRDLPDTGTAVLAW